MKKLFYLFTSLFLSFGLHLNAMEQGVTKEIKATKDIGTPIELPNDILELIASYYPVTEITTNTAPKKDSTAWNKYDRCGTKIELLHDFDEYYIQIKKNSKGKEKKDYITKIRINNSPLSFGLTQDGNYAWCRKCSKNKYFQYKR